MKWIGQHVYDLVSRFRSDVYLESVSSGTIASGGNLGLDSNNKIVKQSDTGITDLHGAGVDGAANQLLTDDGDGTITSEGSLTFNGTELSVTGNTIIQPGEGASATALAITNVIVDQIALDIAASNTTADVLNITADSVTTGNVIDISCDALSTGSALKIEDDSSVIGVGGARNIVDIYQKNKATNMSAVPLYVRADGSQTAVLIDKNASGDASQNARALSIDFDRTVPGSGTAAHNDVGIQVAVNSASLGTSSLKGMDIDVVGATSGTSSATGIDITMSGADSYEGIKITGPEIGFIHSNPTASSATQGGKMVMISQDGAALGDDHRMGILQFGAYDGVGIVTGASIRAFADAAWSTTVNDTRLEFYTMDGDDNEELSLTLDSNLLATFAGGVTVTGTITGDVTGALTGQADTVATIAGLAPNTATTQATQGNITTLNAVTSLGTTSGTMTLNSGAINQYKAVNNGNPVYSMGSSGTNELKIQTLYHSGAQTLESVLFRTETTSSTADDGKVVFQIHGATSLQIDDGGIDFTASHGISIAGTDILTDSSGTATLSNIDALDATTTTTIETALEATTKNMTHHTIKDDIGTGVIYISLGEIDAESGTKSNKNLPILAPVAGKLLKVFLRTVEDMSASGHDTNLTWRLLTRAATATTTGNAAVIGTQTGAGPTSSSMATYDFTSSLDSGTNAIVAGDKVQLSVQSDAASADGLFFITCLWEWDLS